MPPQQRNNNIIQQSFPSPTNFVSAGCARCRIPGRACSVRPARAPCLYKMGALAVPRILRPRRRIGHDGMLAARARGGRRCSVAGRASVACCRPASDAGRQMLQAWNDTTRCCGLPTRLLMMKLVCLFLQKRRPRTESHRVLGARRSRLAQKQRENEWHCQHHLQGLGCPSAESRRGQ